MATHPSIRIEGGLLGPDLLDKLTSGDLPGQRAADFGIEGTRNLTDEIATAFADARAMWGVFQNRLSRLDESDIGTTVTRDAWMVPFLGLLGYEPRYNSRAFDVDGLSFAVSHRAGGPHDAPPIHIVGARQELGRVAASGKPRLAPHSLVQEYLNRTEHVWGLVTNGLTLRLLRDSTLVRRQAYVEFDLSAMIEEQRFQDFAALYRLIHRTRLPKQMADAGDCLLEQYHTQSIEQGGRVRDHLRDGVEKAIDHLANGFLRHPANEDLRHRVLLAADKPNRISGEALYRQLLRLVYRFLFLLVSEDRGLVSDSELYRDHYSIARLRRLLDQRAAWTDHDDLWQSLRVLFYLLRNDSPQTQLGGKPLASTLGLPVLNGELFEGHDLDDCTIRNEDLLGALWNLAYYEDKPEKRRGKATGVIRRVNYAALDVEELGSVYESLLEFHPAVEPDPGDAQRRPRFQLVYGSERKTTGSYYTPPELVGELIRSALEPVIEDRLAAVTKAAGPAGSKVNDKSLAAAKEKALLSIRVCDPACGSGHFLLAAARRLGKELAKVRTGEDEPAPERVREAIRDVVSHCIHGVDRNPLAVDLCRVALWLESHAEGRPLTFLDHRIRCGDSLVGVFSLDVLKAGIPDKAFEPLEGDDKTAARAAAKRNHGERDRPGLYQIDAIESLKRLGGHARQVDAIEDDSPELIRRKRDAFSATRASPVAVSLRRVCNLWTAAFFQPLTNEPGAAPPITTGVIHDLASGRSGNVSQQTIGMAEAIAARERFFHWPLEFPEVFDDGGFDVLLSNPPWERVKLQEQEFFAARDNHIATAPNKAARATLIKRLPEENPALHSEFTAAVRGAEGVSLFLRQSGRYPLCGRGDINTYAVFAELNRHLTAPRGRAGIIVPTGIATDDTTRLYFGDVVQTQTLVSLFSFENEEFVFPAVHHAAKFCLLTTCGRAAPVDSAEFVFLARQVRHLSDDGRRFTQGVEDIRLLSPNTLTCKIFRTARDAAVARAIHERLPVLDNEGLGPIGNPWSLSVRRVLDMNKASTLRRCTEARDALHNRAVFEGKMFHQFDHRFGTYEGQTAAQLRQGKLPEVGDQEHQDPAFSTLPFYWIGAQDVDDALRGRWPCEWLLVWRDITSSSLERTTTATILPRTGTDFTVRVGFLDSHQRDMDGALLLAQFNSFMFDYLSRQSIGGNHLSDYILRQIPTVLPSTFREPCPWDNSLDLMHWIAPRVLELVYTAHDLAGFAHDLGYVEPDGATVKPPFPWNPARRDHLRAELDAAFFHLYGVSRDDAAYIMDTFTVFRARDEERNGGVYKTKDKILAIYDEMADAMVGPTATDLAAFAAVAYPATARDRVICAVARAIVEVLGDTSSMDHLDLLLLATHPNWTKRFLTAADRQSLDAAISRAPAELILTGVEAVRWKDARDHLESQGLIAVDRSSNAQVISIGVASTPRRHDSERVRDVVRLASKALQRARTLQKSTTAVDAETKAVLQLIEDYRKLQLATV